MLRYFSIASLVALVLAVAGLGFFFRQTALEQLVKVGEDHNAALARVLANALRPRYRPLIKAAETLHPDHVKTSPEYAAVHRAVLEAVQDTDIVGVRIYDLNGRVIYSSDPRRFGQDRNAEAGFAAARAGGMKTALYVYDSFDAFGETLRNRQLLVSHVPVRRLYTDDIDAVFELYSDVTPFYEEIRRTQTHLRIGTAIVMILLYGALFLIVKRADGLIRSQAAQRERDQVTILRLAQHDSLTDLPNRKLFEDRLASAIARAKRNEKMAALLFIDLDGFKQINDTLGHAVGDRVLQSAARRIRSSFREMDTVARLGGDEFTMIVEDLTDADHAATVAAKIRETFSASFFIETGAETFVTPSIGIALYPKDGETLETLLASADAAMYAAKAGGRNTYRFYEPLPAEAA